MGAFDFLQPNQQLQPIGVGPLALTPPLPKAQNNVTALNPPAPKPPPYVTGVDVANAASNMSAVQSENALRQQEAAQAGMNTQLLAATLKVQPQIAAAIQQWMNGGSGASNPNAPAPTGAPSGNQGDGSGAAPSAQPQAADPFDIYADRVINSESGGNPNAKNPKSSATGPGQFLDSTWLSVAHQHFPETAQLGDDALLSLRTDPDFSKSMVKAYGQDNAQALSAAGVPVTMGNLYAAHFLGAGGATKVLTAAPDAQLSDLLPAAVVKANPNLGGMTAGRFTANMALKMGGSTAPAGPTSLSAGTNARPPTDTAGDFDDAAYRAQHGNLPDVLALSGKATQPAEVIARARALAAQSAGSGSASVPGAPAPLTVTPAARQSAVQIGGGNASGAAAPTTQAGGALDPTKLAAIGALSDLYKLPNVAAPMLQAFYNSPTYLKAKAAAEGQGALPTQVDLANATANAKLRNDLAAAGMTFGPNNTIVPIPGFNQAKAGTEGAVAAAKAQAVPQELRQGGVLTQYNPATKQYEVVAQAPRLPEGTSLGTGPDGKPVAEEVPGAIPAIQKAQAAVEAGKAQIQPLQEQNEALAKEYETNVVEPFNHAQSAIAPLTAVQNAMQNYKTGPGAETELQLKKAWQSFATAINLPPDSDLAKSIASGEIIKKEGTTLGFELARTLGSRESQMIVQQAIASNPGLANSPQGNQQLISLIRQGLQRDIDKRGYVDSWMQNNKTFVGATDAFNKTHPVETYVSRAVPYSPKSEADYNALPGGVTYFNPHTNSLKVKPLNATANQPAQ